MAVNVYFTNIQDQIIQEINQAEKSVKIAMAWFTNEKLFKTIVNHCKNQLLVELIIIPDSINLRELGLDFNTYIQSNGILYFGQEENLMHHKFCLIDDKVVLSGSYNWTYQAEYSNYENLTVIKGNTDIMQDFNNEFFRITSLANRITFNDSRFDHTSNANSSTFSVENFVLEEYLMNAKYLNSIGHDDKSNDIYKLANKINPAKTYQELNRQDSKNSTFDNLKNELYINSHLNFTKSTYGELCDVIKERIRYSQYIEALTLANACVAKFPRKFSVHVYLGDIKKGLLDYEGSEIEYRIALSTLTYQKTKLHYYNQVYGHPFFPKADIYLKLNDLHNVKRELIEAVKVYKKKNCIRAWILLNTTSI